MSPPIVFIWPEVATCPLSILTVNLHSLFLHATLILAMSTAAFAAPEFKPGAAWLDTAGHPINAHGGGILYHGATYYWYGEYKVGRTYLPKVNQAWGGTRVLAGGVSCYSSTDLQRWKFEGVVLPSVLDNPDSDLACENVIERPKVIFNARTHKFVMWFHQDSPNYAAARSGVAVSDAPTGPFHYLGSFRPDAGAWPLNATEADRTSGPANLLARDQPGGQMARDMTLFVDDDGTAYQFYASEANATMHVSQLSDDYLRPAGKYARIFIGRSTEAPAVFKRGGKYYVIGSGCTGWDPNAARSAVADHIFGPWRELGNPCRGQGADTTFGAQSTYVLPVAGHPDLFIAMFDRWEKWNLPASRYIWLPITFEADGRPVIEWRDHWTLPSRP